jgi:hypothetical protein
VFARNAALFATAESVAAVLGNTRRCLPEGALQALDFFKHRSSTRAVGRTYFVYDLHEFFECQCGHGANLKRSMGSGQDAPAEEVLDRVLVRHFDDRNEIIFAKVAYRSMMR